MCTKDLFLPFLFLSSLALFSQEDTTSTVEEFDFSAFELAAPAAKSFCTNKVLGQSPTPLLGVYYDFQASHGFTAGNLVDSEGADISEENTINAAHGLNLVGNFPLISRNNILINMNLVYQEQRYQMENATAHPLARSLSENGIRRAAALFTVFKPLNDRTFVLGQLGFELNGDYTFNNPQPLNTLRLPIALLYGWKPSDRLMWAVGLSRTYLGGSLNYVPVVYYYKTFRNQRWGMEALLPARATLRYRPNSISLFSLGYTVQGATYRLNRFPSFAEALAQRDPGVPQALQAAEEVELRRSEIRAGLNYSRQLFGFFWISAEVGYRINYSFELDRDGDFVRFFGSDKPYFIENTLENPLYFTIGLSYVSP